MSLATRIQDLATRIAEEFNTVRTEIAALPGADPFDINEVEFIIAAVPNSTTLNSVGSSTGTTGSATSSATQSVTPQMQRFPTIRYRITANTANAVSGMRQAAATLGPIRADGIGGFKIRMTSGPDTGVTSACRFFLGLRQSTSAPSDVDPSTMTNFIGLGYDSADTTVQLMRNDTGYPAVKIDTGWPKAAANSTEFYKLELASFPSAATVKYRATRYTATGEDVITGEFTTRLPANTIFLAMLTYHSIGTATPAPVGIGFGHAIGTYQLG